MLTGKADTAQTADVRVTGGMAVSTERNVKLEGLGAPVSTERTAKIAGGGTNLDFEFSVGGWEPVDATISQTTEQVYSGSASMKVQPDGVADVEGVVSSAQKIMVTPRTRQTVLAKYRSTDGMTMRVDITQYSADDILLQIDSFDVIGTTT